MRKLFVAVFTLCIVAVMGSASFADSITVSTMTASVTFFSQGVVNVGFDLMNLTGGPTTQIWWDPAKIIVGTPDWVGAGAYIVLYSTLTELNSGIEIYTDNMASDANPQYAGGVQTSTGAANPAGLVDANTTTNALRMCWRVAFNPLTQLNIMQIAPGYPMRLWDLSTGDQYPCYLWIMDKGTYAYSSNLDYRTIRDSRGIQHGEATWCVTGSPVYVYFGATFQAGGRLPDTFRTTTIRIEAYTQ